MNINFILARFEPRSKKIRRPICSGFFREKNETIRRQIACSLWALWVAIVCRNFIFFFQVWLFIHFTANNRIIRTNLKWWLVSTPKIWIQRNQWEPQISGCQAFKNILGLQIITSMLAISTIYFYSDQEYPFPGGFQCAHLLLQTWDSGIRPLPVCLYRTLSCTLRNSWLSPASWPSRGHKNW